VRVGLPFQALKAKGGVCTRYVTISTNPQQIPRLYHIRSTLLSITSFKEEFKSSAIKTEKKMCIQQQLDMYCVYLRLGHIYELKFHIYFIPHMYLPIHITHMITHGLGLVKS
jgi:hypothetical protein